MEEVQTRKSEIEKKKQELIMKNTLRLLPKQMHAVVGLCNNPRKYSQYEDHRHVEQRFSDFDLLEKLKKEELAVRRKHSTVIGPENCEQSGSTVSKIQMYDDFIIEKLGMSQKVAKGALQVTKFSQLRFQGKIKETLGELVTKAKAKDEFALQQKNKVFNRHNAYFNETQNTSQDQISNWNQTVTNWPNKTTNNKWTDQSQERSSTE